MKSPFLDFWSFALSKVEELQSQQPEHADAAGPESGHAAAGHSGGHSAAHGAEPLGLSAAQYAFLLAVLSGLSLPVGAMLGVRLKPSDTTVAQWIAIGAGALLFAVSVELYGHSIHSYAAGHIELIPMIILLVMSLAGSFSYTYLTRLCAGEEEEEEGEEEEEVPDGGDEEADIGRRSSDDTASMKSTPRVEPPRCPRRKSFDSGEKKPGDLWVGRSAAHLLVNGRGIGNLMRKVEQNRRRKAQFRWAHLREAMKKYHVIRFIQRQVEKRKSDSARIASFERSASGTTEFWENFKKAWGDTTGSQPDPDPEIMKSSRAAAINMLIMLVVDGIPEGILMGFMAADGSLGFAFVLALVIANFPEGFAGGQLMEQAGYHTLLILAAWSVPMLLTATGSFIACHMLLLLNPTYVGGHTRPYNIQVLVAATEGVAGGAMISGIAACMLPEAYERRDKDGGILLSGGFLCTVGFLLAFGIKIALH